MDYKEFQTELSDNDFREDFDSYDYYIAHGLKSYEQGVKEASNEKDRGNN